MLKHAVVEVPQGCVGPCLFEDCDCRDKEQNFAQAESSNRTCSRKTLLLNTFVNQMVATAFELKAEQLLNIQNREARTYRARQISMYLMNTSLSLNFVEIADFYGKDRSTVSHACGVIEELRDIVKFDEQICEFEQTIVTVLQLFKTGQALADE